MQGLLGQLLGTCNRNAFMLVDDQCIAFIVGAMQPHARTCAIGLDMDVGGA